MKYRLKGKSLTTVYVLDENEGVLSLLVNRDIDGYVEETKEQMKRDMFDMCLRTGYLTAVEEPAVALAV